MLERPYYAELVANVIEPLLEQVQEVKDMVDHRAFTWASYKLDQAIQVVDQEALELFELVKVTDPPEVRQIYTREYYVPYPRMEIRDDLALHVRGFEFDRLPELENAGVLSGMNEFDTILSEFRKLLGSLAVLIAKKVDDLREAWVVNVTLVPYMTQLLFNKLILTEEDFEKFLNTTSSASMNSVRQIYKRERKRIDSVAGSVEIQNQLNLVRKRCEELGNWLSGFEQVLKTHKSTLTTQWRISETQIDELRRKRQEGYVT